LVRKERECLSDVRIENTNPFALPENDRNGGRNLVLSNMLALKATKYHESLI
jgi:hypothetical protein